MLKFRLERSIKMAKKTAAKKTIKKATLKKK